MKKLDEWDKRFIAGEIGTRMVRVGDVVYPPAILRYKGRLFGKCRSCKRVEELHILEAVGSRIYLYGVETWELWRSHRGFIYAICEKCWRKAMAEAGNL